MTRWQRRAVLALALAALSAPAAAQSESPRPDWLRGAAPAGWSAQAGLARNVGTTLRQSALFGRVVVQAGAEAYVQPGAGAFYLSWVEADAAAPDAVRGAFDRLRARRAASSPEARSTEELRYAERVDAGVASAELEWRHLSNESLTLVRAFAWLSRAGAPRLAIAECVLGTTGGAAPAAVDAACRGALASLAIAAPTSERGALAALSPGRVSAETEPGADLLAPEAASRPPTVGPAGAGGAGRVLYRGPEPAPESGRRWLVLIGAAVMIAAFYLTARTRRSQPAGDGAGAPADRVSPEQPDVGPEKTP